MSTTVHIFDTAKDFMTTAQFPRSPLVGEVINWDGKRWYRIERVEWMITPGDKTTGTDVAVTMRIEVRTHLP